MIATIPLPCPEPQDDTPVTTPLATWWLERILKPLPREERFIILTTVIAHHERLGRTLQALDITDLYLEHLEEICGRQSASLN